MSRLILTLAQGDHVLRLEDGVWTGDDDDWVALAELTARLRPDTGYEPDPDVADAEYVAAQLGATVTTRLIVPATVAEGAVF